MHPEIPTRTTRQLSHTAFYRQKFSPSEITTTYPDNPPTQHTAQPPWTHSPHVGVQLLPSQLMATATVFVAHVPSECIKFTGATVSRSLEQRPQAGSCHHTHILSEVCPSVTLLLSRHKTVTIHRPPTIEPHSQPTCV
ncbi:unnamed protein product [Rangifer tarandus platyrhynchus]|uniref:Uncharacterized protein n=2 Tax=Rangifer tarandus platyrhynchus TaxID=3082113 RepID=A0ABN8YJ24_RANTA|nr:unnamed protein product [Rangifer tarandus platyrhynchus]